MRLLSRQPPCKNRNEDQVVDAQYDFEDGQREKARPDLGIAQPIHANSPSRCVSSRPIRPATTPFSREACPLRLRFVERDGSPNRSDRTFAVTSLSPSESESGSTRYYRCKPPPRPLSGRGVPQPRALQLLAWHRGPERQFCRL